MCVCVCVCVLRAYGDWSNVVCVRPRVFVFISVCVRACVGVCMCMHACVGVRKWSMRSMLGAGFRVC